jgi:hypothetical protein
MITVASLFRDSASYVDRYANQIKELNDAMPTRVVAVYGDCTDRTGWLLFDALEGVDAELLHVDHGGPPFGPLDNPQRWRQMAAVGNVALAASCRVTAPEDHFCYIESDLIWTPDTIMALIADLNEVPAVAPMAMYDGRFYDTFGHVKDGIAFERHPPYHPGWEDHLFKIDSAGSCFVTSGKLLPLLQFSPTDCIRGIGRSLYAHGYGLWLDPNVEVVHP